MGTTTNSKRRKEDGQERAKERGQKGRLIQERDRWGLAWVGMNRVVREKTLREVLFSGRDGATFGNHVWETVGGLPEEPAGRAREVEGSGRWQDRLVHSASET